MELWNEWMTQTPPPPQSNKYSHRFTWIREKRGDIVLVFRETIKKSLSRFEISYSMFNSFAGNSNYPTRTCIRFTFHSQSLPSFGDFFSSFVFVVLNELRWTASRHVNEIWWSWINSLITVWRERINHKWTYVFWFNINAFGVVENQHFPQRFQINAIVWWKLDSLIGPGHWLFDECSHYPSSKKLCFSKRERKKPRDVTHARDSQIINYLR